MGRRRGREGKRRATRFQRAAYAGRCAKACMAVGSTRGYPFGKGATRCESRNHCVVALVAVQNRDRDDDNRFSSSTTRGRASSRMVHSATGFGGRACVACHAHSYGDTARPRGGLAPPADPRRTARLGAGGRRLGDASGSIGRSVRGRRGGNARSSPVRAALPSINDLGSAARVDVMRAKPLFTIGLFADAQYADRPDHERPNEPGRVKRFRAAPDRVREAMGHFTRPDMRETMACIVNLGDLIEGVNDDDVTVRPGHVPTRTKAMPAAMRDANARDLRVMVAAVNDVVRGAVPVVHCLGNHDLNVESRERALEILYGGKSANVSGSTLPTRALSYFSRKLPRRWRLVVLDTTELNPRFAPPASETQRRCEAFVRERHAIGRVDASNDAYRTSSKPWGGGLGPEQMEWLRGELRNATRRGERVVVASHVPLSRTAARPGMAAWNCDEISALLEACPAVALCVAGHDHPGRYGRTLVPSVETDAPYKTFGRVHFVTLEAMLEAPADGNAFAALEVYDHEVIVNAGGAARGFFGNKHALVKRGEATTSPLRPRDARGDGVSVADAASSGKNHATDRRLRVSPRGRFTGVAGFGERVPGSPSGEDGTNESISIRVRGGSNQQAVDLLDWINADADDEDADGA